MARKQPSQRNTTLPGSLYQRNRRWWWKVQLPGENKPKARPLKPVGSRYATTDYSVAVECAKCLLQQQLFQKDVPAQGDVKIIPDLVRAYMEHANSYYVDSNGKPTQEPNGFRYALGVLLDCFPSLAVDEFGPLRLKEVREAMIDKNWCRNLINRRIGMIRRMFKWAVSEQIVSPVILNGLEAVAGLKRGRTGTADPFPATACQGLLLYTSRVREPTASKADRPAEDTVVMRKPSRDESKSRAGPNIQRTLRLDQLSNLR